MTIESVGIIVGMILGITSMTMTIIQSIRARNQEQLMEKKEQEREKLLEKKEQEREKKEQEREKKEQEREQLMEKKEQEREKKEQEREKKEQEREKLMEKKEQEREKLMEKKDRLMFLVQVILDKNIPIKSRQPFYDEYIGLGGNSTIVKFWLEEVGSQG